MIKTNFFSTEELIKITFQLGHVFDCELIAESFMEISPEDSYSVKFCSSNTLFTQLNRFIWSWTHWSIFCPLLSPKQRKESETQCQTDSKFDLEVVESKEPVSMETRSSDYVSRYVFNKLWSRGSMCCVCAALCEPFLPWLRTTVQTVVLLATVLVSLFQGVATDSALLPWWPLVFLPRKDRAEIGAERVYDWITQLFAIKWKWPWPPQTPSHPAASATGSQCHFTSLSAHRQEFLLSQTSQIWSVAIIYELPLTSCGLIDGVCMLKFVGWILLPCHIQNISKNLIKLYFFPPPVIISCIFWSALKWQTSHPAPLL